MDIALWDDVYLVLLGVTAFAALLLLIRWGLSALPRAVKWFREGVLASNMSPSAFDQMVELKVGNYRILMQAGCIFFFSWIVFTGMNVLRAAEPGERKATVTQDILLIAFAGLCMLVVAMPSVITPRTLDLHYCMMVACVCAYVTPYTTTLQGMLGSIYASNGAMVLMNCTRRTVPGRRCPVFLLGNLLYMVCSASAVYVHGSEILDRPVTTAIVQVITVLASIFGAWLLEVAFRAVVDQDMKLREVRELYAAACALLHMCCEVVVELDAEGVIVSKASNLKSFLLKSGPDVGMRGMRLSDLIFEREERKQFLETLSQPRNQKVGLAESMQVSMKDGCNNSLRLELLWFQFQRTGGSRHAMVGVREPLPGSSSTNDLKQVTSSMDLTAARSSEPSTCVPSQPNISTTLEVCDGGMDSLPTRTISDSASIPSIPEESSVTSGSWDETAAVLFLDCSAAGWPIRDVTPGFRSKLGSLPQDEPVLRFVSTPANFVNWLQVSLNRACVSLDVEDFDIKLQLPRRKVKAKCRLMTANDRRADDETPDNADSPPIEVFRVGLVFFDIRHNHSHSHHRNGPRRTCRTRGTPSSRPPETAKFMSL